MSKTFWVSVAANIFVLFVAAVWYKFYNRGS